MTRVLLVRHGHHAEIGRVLSGRSEIGLDSQGQAEAAKLADRLGRIEIDAVHTSPRQRARQTAGPLVARIGVDPVIAPALDEVDFGAWQGKRFAELAGNADWTLWNERRSHGRPPGGEGMEAAVARARRHIEAAAERVRVLLCVSHCDIIRGLVAHYIGLHIDRMLAFDVDPGSVTTLDLFPGGARVISVNERLP